MRWSSCGFMSLSWWLLIFECVLLFSLSPLYEPPLWVYVFVCVQPATTMPAHMTLLGSDWKAPKLCNPCPTVFSWPLFILFICAYADPHTHTHTHLQTLFYKALLCHWVRTAAASVCNVKGCSFKYQKPLDSWFCFSISSIKRKKISFLIQ